MAPAKSIPKRALAARHGDCSLASMAQQEASGARGAPGHSKLVQAAAAIVLIFAIRFAKEVLVPIALAVLFSFLLAPLVHLLEKRRIGRAPSVLIVVLL